MRGLDGAGLSYWPPDSDYRTERPHLVDGCKAWTPDGEIVATLYPQFHRVRG